LVQNSIRTEIPRGNNRQHCDRTYFLMLQSFHRALPEVLAIGLQRTCSPRVNTPCAGPAKRISYAGWPNLDGSYTSLGTFPCTLISSCSTIPSLVPWQPSRWPEMLIKLSHYRTPKYATILSSECTVFQGRLPYSSACMVLCPRSRGPGTPMALQMLKREWHPKCSSTSCVVYARLEAC
jgi:hypothetical protein